MKNEIKKRIKTLKNNSFYSESLVIINFKQWEAPHISIFENKGVCVGSYIKLLTISNLNVKK